MTRALPALVAPSALLALFALVAAAPPQDSGGRGWVLAGFATATAVAGVRLCLVVRRRRAEADAERVRDCVP